VVAMICDKSALQKFADRGLQEAAGPGLFTVLLLSN
jgi:hypothetical protein